jgi:hypothetical protein
MVGNITYRLLGAGEGGTPALIILFISVLGAGGLINISYVLLEGRI